MRTPYYTKIALLAAFTLITCLSCGEGEKTEAGVYFKPPFNAAKDLQVLELINNRGNNSLTRRDLIEDILVKNPTIKVEALGGTGYRLLVVFRRQK